MNSITTSSKNQPASTVSENSKAVKAWTETDSFSWPFRILTWMDSLNNWTESTNWPKTNDESESSSSFPMKSGMSRTSPTLSDLERKP